MLRAIYQKITSFFASVEMNAAQAWGIKEGNVTHAFWMYAAPVNMQLGRDSYFLTDPESIMIKEEESVALVESLNAHFTGLGYYFYVKDSVWFLGLDNDPQVTATHIQQVKNQDIANYLPQGEGALVWNKLQNEIQMLLFSHPINQIRESKGLPMINSLWCYGLGKSL